MEIFIAGSGVGVGGSMGASVGVWGRARAIGRNKARMEMNIVNVIILQSK